VLLVWLSITPCLTSAFVSAVLKGLFDSLKRAHADSSVKAVVVTGGALGSLQHPGHQWISTLRQGSACSCTAQLFAPGIDTAEQKLFCGMLVCAATPAVV
jgi:hypothetical protein